MPAELIAGSRGRPSPIRICEERRGALSPLRFASRRFASLGGARAHAAPAAPIRRIGRNGAMLFAYCALRPRTRATRPAGLDRRSAGWANEAVTAQIGMNVFRPAEIGRDRADAHLQPALQDVSRQLHAGRAAPHVSGRACGRQPGLRATGHTARCATAQCASLIAPYVRCPLLSLLCADA